MFRVTLDGLRRYRNHPEARIRDRFEREAQSLGNAYSAAAWAMRKWYRKDPRMRAKVDAVLRDIYEQFGLKPRIIAPLLGRAVYIAMKREAKRLAAGWTYEPGTFYEKNAQAQALEQTDGVRSTAVSPALEWVTCELLPAVD